MTKDELKNRTKQFAIKIVELVNDLPNTKAGNTVANQITIVEEECDETLFWLEFIWESKILKKERVVWLLKEADELTAIFTASGRTAKQIKA